MLSITSDYVQSTGDPQPYLERIAAAGFAHVHWCHHWNTDFLYSKPEIDQIERWFAEDNLRLLNLHASIPRTVLRAGQVARRNIGVRCWNISARPGSNWSRTASRWRPGSGRMWLLSMCRLMPRRNSKGNRSGPVCRSLDELLSFAQGQGVRIAVENMETDDFGMLTTLLDAYDAGVLGLCYDSGHGNIDGRGLDNLEKIKARLIALHLHDNDGVSNQHKLPLTGTVDWERLARIISVSPYDKCLNLEVVIQNSGITGEAEFLRQAYAAGEKLASMVEKYRR